MREIRFRAWDVMRGRYRVGCDNLMMDLGGTLYWQFAFDAPMPLGPEQEDFIVEQFTGLQDENLVDIYEGDILDGFGAVSFHHRYLGFFAWNKNYETWVPIYDIYTTTIIGNIHENPELLRGTDETK